MNFYVLGRGENNHKIENSGNFLNFPMTSNKLCLCFPHILIYLSAFLYITVVTFLLDLPAARICTFPSEFLLVLIFLKMSVV